MKRSLLRECLCLSAILVIVAGGFCMGSSRIHSILKYHRALTIPATLVIAANDSLGKDSADKVCEGVDDQVTIQEALDVSPIGSDIVLSPGNYNISDLIVDERILRGSGIGVVLNVTGTIHVKNCASLGKVSVKTAAAYAGVAVKLEGRNQTTDNLPVGPARDLSPIGTTRLLNDLEIYCPTQTGTGLLIYHEGDQTAGCTIGRIKVRGFEYGVHLHAVGTGYITGNVFESFFIWGSKYLFKLNDESAGGLDGNTFQSIQLQPTAGTARGIHIIAGELNNFLAVFAWDWGAGHGNALQIDSGRANYVFGFLPVVLNSEYSSIIINHVPTAPYNLEWFGGVLPFTLAKVSENLLQNGSFEIGDPPVGWTYTGCVGSREATIIKEGTYSCKIVASVDNSGVTQAIDDSIRYKGRRLTLGLWVRAPATNTGNPYIYLMGTGGSSFLGHIVQNDAWHWMEGSLVVPTTTTNLYVNIFLDKADDIVYVDGAVLLASNVRSCSDTFMDVLAVTANHIVNAQNLLNGAVAIANQPKYARELDIAITEVGGAVSAYTMTIVGVDAKGNTVTEVFTFADDGLTFECKPLITVTSITLADVVDAGNATFNVGIGGKLGLKNPIHETGDVYMITKNYTKQAVAVAQVDVDFDAYDIAAVIGLAATDDFEIWYRSNPVTVG